MQRVAPSRLVIPPAYEPGLRALLATHQQLQEVPGRYGLNISVNIPVV